MIHENKKGTEPGPFFSIVLSRANSLSKIGCLRAASGFKPLQANWAVRQDAIHGCAPVEGGEQADEQAWHWGFFK